MGLTCMDIKGKLILLEINTYQTYFFLHDSLQAELKYPVP